jgi:hypothetical protein
LGSIKKWPGLTPTVNPGLYFRDFVDVLVIGGCLDWQADDGLVLVTGTLGCGLKSSEMLQLGAIKNWPGLTPTMNAGGVLK